MRKFILLFFVIVVAACSPKPSLPDQAIVTVKRNYKVPKEAEQVSIAIPIQELSKRLNYSDDNPLTVVDQNFGRIIEPEVIDSDDDGASDFIVFDYTFESNEPIITFKVSVTSGESILKKKSVSPDDRLEISYMRFLPEYETENGKIQDFSSSLVKSTMNIYPDVKDFPIYNPNKWNYEYSFFMLGSYRLGKKLNNPEFISYPKSWIDDFIAEEGGFKEDVYQMAEYKLDDVLPGRLAICMHQETNHPKYKSVADTLIVHLTNQPKTKDGGYWHKEIYPYQMWLDGIFMGDVFSMQYAQAYNEPAWFDEAMHQIDLIYEHTRDSVTGLLYHGWDESKNPVWANPETGTSPEFWGRAVGWYMMALVECLDYIPNDHPGRERITEILKELSAAVIPYQDNETKLWYQVMDKGEREGNWIETSCSAMFAYAFAKGHRFGILEDQYLQSAEEAFEAICKDYVYVDEKGNLHLDQTVKVGTLNTKTSKGDFDYYVTTERRLDDYKGLASLLFLSIELNK